jgi:hypothetical protein
MTVRILLGIDIAAAAVVDYFFIVGLTDGSISAFNIELWLGLLLALAAALAAGLALRRAGRPIWQASFSRSRRRSMACSCSS